MDTILKMVIPVNNRKITRTLFVGRMCGGSTIQVGKINQFSIHFMGRIIPLSNTFFK
jgi:hypothetical protein